MKSIFTIVTVIALVTSGCYYESEEHLYPTTNSSCDTANVTYTASIVPLLNNNCYSCHGSNASSGLNFQDTSVLRAQIRSGQLYKSITYQNLPMPPSEQLPSCQIQIFKKWIDAGASFK
jgi:hypothetical protein